MIIRSSFRVITLWVLFLTSSLRSTSVYETIAQHLLPNTAVLKTEEALLSEYQEYKTALYILHTGSADLGIVDENQLGTTTIEDLNLLYNPQQPSFTILNRLARTETTLGTCYLAKKLITPQTDIKTLERDQAITRTLIENAPLRTSLDNALKRFRKQEQTILTLWNPEDLLYGTNISETFYDGDLSKSTSKTVLEASNKIRDAMSITSPLFTFLAMEFAGNMALPSATAIGWRKKVKTIVGILIKLLSTYGIYNSISELVTTTKNRRMLLAKMRDRFRSLRVLHDTLVYLTSWSQQHRSFVRLMPALTQIIAFTQQRHSTMNRFLRSLASKAFNQGDQYWRIGAVGPVLAALPQFIALKDRFCPVLHTIAELDAYLSIAKLYLEHQNSPRKYTFASFNTESKTPALVAHDFWHPSLSPDKAIPNTLELGANGHAQNMVLTGPNAAGKSTLSKAIVLSAILAQAFTICPANYLMLTPFTKIHTYLNIVQDLGKRSAHRAEVQRSKQFVDSIATLSPDKFALTMLDEMYRFTDPSSGAANSFGVAEWLGKKSNSALIFATHYSRLTGLQAHTDGRFENYKVEATKNNDGSFTYPYQIVPGANETVIVFDMMANEGFNKDVLAYAYEHLEHLQKDEHAPRDEEQVQEFVSDLRETIKAGKRVTR